MANPLSSNKKKKKNCTRPTLFPISLHSHPLSFRLSSTLNVCRTLLPTAVFLQSLSNSLQKVMYPFTEDHTLLMLQWDLSAHTHVHFPVTGNLSAHTHLRFPERGNLKDYPLFTGTKISCTSVPVYEGDPTSVTCHFNSNLRETKDDFFVYRSFKTRGKNQTGKKLHYCIYKPPGVPFPMTAGL